MESALAQACRIALCLADLCLNDMESFINSHIH